MDVKKQVHVTKIKTQHVYHQNIKLFNFRKLFNLPIYNKKVAFYLYKSLILGNFVSQNKSKKMLHDKSTKIISELKNYFSSTAIQGEKKSEIDLLRLIAWSKARLSASPKSRKSAVIKG